MMENKSKIKVIVEINIDDVIEQINKLDTEEKWNYIDKILNNIRIDDVDNESKKKMSFGLFMKKL